MLELGDRWFFIVKVHSLLKESDNNSSSCLSASGYGAIFHKPFTAQSLA